MNTLEDIEAAVQQLPPAKRAEFKAWFLSFGPPSMPAGCSEQFLAPNLERWLASCKTKF
jgi:hypothetical protein